MISSTNAPESSRWTAIAAARPPSAINPATSASLLEEAADAATLFAVGAAVVWSKGEVLVAHYEDGTRRAVASLAHVDLSRLVRVSGCNVAIDCETSRSRDVALGLVAALAYSAARRGAPLEARRIVRLRRRLPLLALVSDAEVAAEIGDATATVAAEGASPALSERRPLAIAA